MTSPAQDPATVGPVSDSSQNSGSWWNQLQPASFRGVPFRVIDASGQAGRRNADHEYPFRDIGWVEDLGRSQRRLQVVGFVVGDDVIAQRQRMLDAVEKAGDGELVHPTLGRVQVALMGFDWHEPEGKGRVIQYRFQFIRQGQRLYPDSQVNGQADVASASTLAQASTTAAFATRTAPVLGNGAAIVTRATGQASAWSQQALTVGNDATSLIKLAVSLPGQYGRLLGLASGLTVGEIIPKNADLTVADLVSAAAQARASIAAACTSLVGAAGQLGAGDTSGFCAAAQALVSLIQTTAPTPRDALRGLLTLATYTPLSGAVGDEAIVQGACADLFRRSALTGMTVAASNYQPQSAADATAVRTLVLGVLDAEITTAGDQFEDDVYASLRALRAKSVSDLNARGAQLPTLVTVSTAASMPSLALAQRLYRDAGRNDEIVARANPKHPAFMPRQFQALNQ